MKGGRCGGGGIHQLILHEFGDKATTVNNLLICRLHCYIRVLAVAYSLSCSNSGDSTKAQGDRHVYPKRQYPVTEATAEAEYAATDLFRSYQQQKEGNPDGHSNHKSATATGRRPAAEQAVATIRSNQSRAVATELRPRLSLDGRPRLVRDG